MLKVLMSKLKACFYKRNGEANFWHKLTNFKFYKEAWASKIFSNTEMDKLTKLLTAELLLFKKLVHFLFHL